MNKLLLLPIFAIIFLSGCVGQTEEVGNKTVPTGGAAEVLTETTTTETTTPTVQTKEFTVHGSSYKLTPSTITVNKGDRVKITYISDDIGHNLVIDGYNVQTKTISGGASDVIEFTADKAGTFAVYCSVGYHRSFGMESKLIVQ